MKKITSQIEYEIYTNSDELPKQDQGLLKEAVAAAGNAYAPYSGFNVGAAVLLDNGVIVQGNNQENAAYPSGLCAERVAVFSASANYPGIHIKAIAITAKFNSKNEILAVSPCGNCRQVIAEYEHRFNNNIRLIMTGENNSVVVFPSIKMLLPMLFNSGMLK